MIDLLENNIRGGISGVMGDRFVKSDIDKNILYIVANNLCGHRMSQSLPDDEIQFDKNVNLEDTLSTTDNSDIQ